MPVVEVILRLLTATLLGGLIGMERENRNRAAGFRTHILVSIGSALVMVTSEYIFNMYKGTTNLDPARLGAQVISGIGFLGAGTIIKEGPNVKGLTTAATLWAVSCVGIVAGAGFYEAAVLGTVMIYLTLGLLGKLEGALSKDNTVVLSLNLDRQQGQFVKVNSLIRDAKAKVRKMEIITQDEDKAYLQMIVQMSNDKGKEKFIKDILGLKDENISVI